MMLILTSVQITLFLREQNYNLKFELDIICVQIVSFGQHRKI